MTKKVALVTGASRGIGRAIAEKLVADGCFVIGTATSDGGADAISAYLAENGKGMKLNVSDAESIAEVIKNIADEYGAPAILVNNAGITRDNLLMRMKDAEWDDIINTNLTSVFRMSKAVLRGMMKARSGRIINISSVVGTTGNAGQANYAAAKAGMVGFAKSMAKEVGSRGITVNTVAPGFIDTDMTRELSDDIKKGLLAGIPLARLGDAQEIANAVAFLASEGASYITGETLHVNGGMFMA
ncbi:3-oxoacyl-[acyl-carrier protein] reductase [Bathymodiolus platifrons methanotrophic gill symbiont]|uniref:3-oxoacyl-ACP reductase FabG n=1 Tax=Bathymodiolus platifrons methanotrophic gill symbiont TaxID=113268 RepID=UPI000B4127CF|nr:3-oxoacyl-ACP reductase FabG [Methyloprofundus sp.]TXK97299.1 3-oxoacyl-ACP reductase [Methylococcaceae bacterium CS4]TXK99171.1 3-oxoacyl-ACP reductase [Methylococcaceae bacterium CS5]TXL01732.1 3-oxoacyl-ACP reductase [Methylococcaceae bacterium HT1]TXL08622.1 3-oxoacyl-ACP reductase [Methylococcaceae bacterium CS1]TXL08735.1 3-oxoacyl-ACP reductase [Methylococcaceae bacterium CS3]TXL12266.1 3-oxoacyl-ACP reductase [Methylococcaceae bacterium CS2]TXL15872.1 3-oxoacyl-ACP reductase [Meth